MMSESFDRNLSPFAPQPRQQTMRHSHGTSLLIGTLLAAALAGCGHESRFASQLPTPKGPIAVEARVDGSGKITTALNGNEPNVIFHFGNNRRVLIEQTRILVDDELYPAAPEGTKTIGIDVTNGQVTLTADGVPITK